MATSDLMQEAIAKHQSGDFESAGTLYKTVLDQDPKCADAWHLAGVLSHQIGNHENSLNFIQRAIELDDQVPAYFANMATALLEQGYVEQANVVAKRCMKIDDRNSIALNVLGTTYLELSQFEHAEATYQRAVEVTGNADAYSNLCRLYFLTGQLDKAVTAGEQALEVNPHHFQCLNNLGSVYRSLRRYEEAENLYVRAIAESEASGEIGPELRASIRVNYCAVLSHLGRVHEAEQVLLEQLENAPNHSMTWNALGQIYQDAARIPESIHCFAKAIQSRPESRVAASNLLYGINIDPSFDRQDVYEKHCKLTAMLPRTTQPIQFANGKQADRKLRIGYVSADFRAHAMRGFMDPLLNLYDRNQFEVFCYSEVSCPDERTVEISKNSDGWFNTCGQTAASVREKIVHDEIDVLVDLAGHTAGNRLDVFSLKSAPVQVSMIGYLNTTGLTEVDYYVSDAIRDPEDEDRFYSEQVVRLPSGGISWQPPVDAPTVADAPYQRNGYLTFGSTHRPNKLNDLTLKTWSNILCQVENARLLLFRNDFRDNLELQGLTLERLQEAGISQERVSLAWDSENDYLHAYHEMDILLECFPWASGTTALESLWMGVPIPTLLGDRPSCRATASALSRLGLDDLVAKSPDDYVQIVISSANETDRLGELRKQLRQRMEANLCNGETFIRELEAAYRMMWKAWCHE